MAMTEQLKDPPRTSENGKDERAGEPREDDGLSIGGRHILSASPLIWILLAAAVAWAVWATVTRGTSSSSSAGVRAVVVPTAGADRMVVAMPCPGGGSQGGSKRPSASGSVVLPRDSGDRVVLVPGCKGGQGAAGGSSGGGGGGGAVQVLSPGAPIPKQGAKAPVQSGGKVRNVFRVPAAGAPRLIVVTPCSGSKGGTSGGRPTAPPPSSGRGVLVSPSCGGSGSS
jgi:hypothetical protein